MFSIVDLTTRTLDYGIPGISPALAVLLLLLILGLPMIPYVVQYVALREKESRASNAVAISPFEKMIAWVHVHRHPELLHH